MLLLNFESQGNTEDEEARALAAESLVDVAQLEEAVAAAGSRWEEVLENWAYDGTMSQFCRSSDTNSEAVLSELPSWSSLVQDTHSAQEILGPDALALPLSSLTVSEIIASQIDASGLFAAQRADPAA